MASGNHHQLDVLYTDEMRLVVSMLTDRRLSNLDEDPERVNTTHLEVSLEFQDFISSESITTLVEEFFLIHDMVASELLLKVTGMKISG